MRTNSASFLYVKFNDNQMLVLSLREAVGTSTGDANHTVATILGKGSLDRGLSLVRQRTPSVADSSPMARLRLSSYTYYIKIGFIQRDNHDQEVSPVLILQINRVKINQYRGDG